MLAWLFESTKASASLVGQIRQLGRPSRTPPFDPTEKSGDTVRVMVVDVDRPAITQGFGCVTKNPDETHVPVAPPG